MCVIAISGRGARQPSIAELRAMFYHKPHGAGYMLARAGRVEIHKGFMDFESFRYAVLSERFTKSDPVVYHFRISTQAGVNPEMTQPFPLTSRPKITKALDVLCSVGIAHNGIIPITTDHTQTEYSDTALFITGYLAGMIRGTGDIAIPELQSEIESMIGWSRLAIMDGTGEIATIGKFTEHNGILLSNLNHIHTKSWKF